MDAIGGQEMLMPVLTPAELWTSRGRYGIPELFKLEDRNGREFVLPMTHEETFTFHARELQSYRQLPQSSTTSRRRTATSRARAAACCASASSS